MLLDRSEARPPRLPLAHARAVQTLKELLCSEKNTANVPHHRDQLEHGPLGGLVQPLAAEGPVHQLHGMPGHTGHRLGLLGAVPLTPHHGQHDFGYPLRQHGPAADVEPSLAAKVHRPRGLGSLRRTQGCYIAHGIRFFTAWEPRHPRGDRKQVGLRVLRWDVLEGGGRTRPPATWMDDVVSLRTDCWEHFNRPLLEFPS